MTGWLRRPESSPACNHEDKPGMLRVSQCTAPVGLGSSWSILNSTRKPVWSLENTGWITEISPISICNLSSSPQKVLLRFGIHSYIQAHFCINGWGSKCGHFCTAIHEPAFYNKVFQRARFKCSTVSNQSTVLTCTCTSVRSALPHQLYCEEALIKISERLNGKFSPPFMYCQSFKPAHIRCS